MPCGFCLTQLHCEVLKTLHNGTLSGILKIQIHIIRGVVLLAIGLFRINFSLKDDLCDYFSVCLLFLSGVHRR